MTSPDEKREARKIKIVRCQHAPKKYGYIQWHEWAEKQTKKGTKQTQCSECGLWFFPEEM